eukprot:g984.t1
MDNYSVRSICKDLKRASFLLDESCCYRSSQWAQELLIDIQDHYRATNRGFTTELELNEEDEDDFDQHYLLGREYFTINEFNQAAETLKMSQSKRAPFLRFFSEYSAIEKNLMERCLTPKNAPDKDPGALAVLEVEVKEAMEKYRDDGLLRYLYGIILIDRGRRLEATKYLIYSLELFPVHWGAWLALSESLKMPLEATRDDIPVIDHWMKHFYLAYSHNSMRRIQEALLELDEVDKIAPNSRFLMGLRANTLNGARQYDEAKKLYEKLMERDPHRLEDLDTYSNILFAGENAMEEIGALATRAAHTNSMSPITCCIIGNYYASAKDHTKAISYYDQALRINRYYSSAWTLMGHELVAQGTIQEATDAYTRAVRQNPLDYKAWYGLGQTHELLEMSAFAVHYFEKAALVVRTDDRFWTALAIAYVNPRVDKPEMAVSCFKEAIKLGDLDGSATKKLAELYVVNEEQEKAARCYVQYVDRFFSDQKNSTNLGDALFFLTKYEAENCHQTKAQKYLDMLKSLRSDGTLFTEKIQELETLLRECFP